MLTWKRLKSAYSVAFDKSGRQKLEKFDINTKEKAEDAKAKIEAQDFKISKIERKKPTVIRRRRSRRLRYSRKPRESCDSRPKNHAGRAAFV